MGEEKDRGTPTRTGRIRRAVRKLLHRGVQHRDIPFHDLVAAGFVIELSRAHFAAAAVVGVLYVALRHLAELGDV